MRANGSAHEDSVVQHTRFRAIKDDIKCYMGLSIEIGEPMCVALEGCTGAGKTTLVKALEADLRHGVNPLEVFYMMTPANVTVKGMVSGMLQRLGDPHFDDSRLTTLDVRLQRIIHSRNIKLVILDDIQHMVQSRKTVAGGQIVSVSEWLKVFIKQVNIPVLIVSTENQCELLLGANDQLSRLVVAKYTLGPLGFSTEDEQTEFYKFVTFYMESLGSKFDPSLDGNALFELIARIHLVTEGIANKVTKLLLIGATRAKSAGSNIISARILDQVVSIRLFEKHDEYGNVLPSNPFMSDLLKQSSN